jgi:hypothetical protein
MKKSLNFRERERKREREGDTLSVEHLRRKAEKQGEWGWFARVGRAFQLKWGNVLGFGSRTQSE